MLKNTKPFADDGFREFDAEFLFHESYVGLNITCFFIFILQQRSHFYRFSVIPLKKGIQVA
jgi:hypothetical protein